MNSKGFTLLEMIVATTILISGLLAVYASSASMLSRVYDNQNRLVASYLAQEGIEIVRNIRDQNWADEVDWRNGLGIGDWQAQYNSNSLVAHTGTSLLLSEADFYNYNSGDDTVFSRKITISHPGADSLKVMVELSWPYDRDNPVRAEQILYNWF